MVNRRATGSGGHAHDTVLNSSKGQPFLMVVGASNEVFTVPAKEPSITLGRDRNRDVFVDEPTVSRSHAEILRDSEGCRLLDLNSKNGTFVNRRDIGAEPYQLKDGDEIRLGSSFTVLIFRETGNGSLDQIIARKLGGGDEPLRSEEDGTTATKSVAWSSLHSREPGAGEKIFGAPGSDIYAGTVRLRVTVEDESQSLPRLIEALNRNPKLVLLKVVSDSPKDADITVTLWEPLPLLSLLAGLDHVARVSPMEEEGEPGNAGALTGGRERVISVSLSSEPHLPHS